MNQDTQPTLVANNDDVTPFMGFAALMRMDGSALAQLMNSLAKNPMDARILMQYASIIFLSGNREFALTLQARALAMQQLYHLPAPAGKAGIRLLAIMRPGDMMDNTPLDLLLEGSDVSLDMLFVSPVRPFPSELPDHDAVFVAIGESAENRPLLKQVGNRLKSWPRTVLNAPDRVSRQSRDGVSTVLGSAPGISMPITTRVDRQTLQRVGSQTLAISTLLDDGAFTFPIIVRPLDTHAGEGLAKLDNAAAIGDYLQTRPESEFYVSRFVDYRGADGLFRKYRIALIDGQPFACHMAISGHWMIHYKNSGMAESADKRAEEAHFMDSFDEDFARLHAAAFRAIHQRMGLDYVVIDCAENVDGQLLIFEVDSRGSVHALDSVDVFPYKQPQMRKVFAAFREMLSRAVHR